MAFENAIITKEDDEKYGLSEIWLKHNSKYDTFMNRLEWTIDRDRNCWLWKMYNFEDPNYDRALLAKAVWILYCDSTQIYVVLDQKGSGYAIGRIPQNLETPRFKTKSYSKS